MHIPFGEALRRIRIEKGMSQQKLAGMINMDRSTITNWENGRRLPDATLISKLSECLDVDINRLLQSPNKDDETITIIMLDDEKIILDGGCSVLKEVLPDADIHSFTEPDHAIRFAKENKVKIAFVDIELGRISGLDVCRELLEIEPDMNVIFLTAFSQYALDAWKTGACGFIEKPLCVEDVKWQIAHLHDPI